MSAESQYCHHCAAWHTDNEPCLSVRAPSEWAPAGLLEDLESVLRLVNEAEGCLIIGKVARGKVMISKAKSILEEMVETKPGQSSNDRTERQTPTAPVTDKKTL